MADENKDDLTPEQEEFLAASAEELNDSLNQAAMKELWAQFHDIHQGLLSGGFTASEANGIVVDLMWKFMQEGTE